VNLKGIYYGVGSNVVGNILMLGATLWLTRILDPAQFGQFRVGSNFALLIIPFLALGGERLLSRLVQSEKENIAPISSTIKAVLSIAITGTAFLAIAYPFISEFIFDNQIPPTIYYVSLLLIPITIAYNLANTLWRHLGSASDAQVDLNFTQRLFRAPLLVVLSLSYPNAVSASLAMLISQLVSLFRVRRYLLQFPQKAGGSASFAVRTNFLQLCVIGFPVAVMAAVDRLDVLLINAVMGVATAGTYDLIYMLSLTAMFPAMAMSKTSEPILYSLKNDKNKMDSLARLQTRAFALSCVAIASIGIAAPILQNFLGNAGPDFARSALILSAGLAFSSVHGPVIEYLQINGKTKFSLIVVMTLLLVFFILKYFAAVSGSLILVAALGGLFYFSMRLFMSIYIFYTDRVVMAKPSIILLSFFGYIAVAVIVWKDWL
jgi:O-antigen/teichoic acid export membrane protein